MTSHIFWYPVHIIHFMVIKHKRILCHKVICFLCVVLWRDVCIQKFFYNILVCIFITNPWNTYDIVPSIIRRRNFGKVRLGTFSVFLAGKYFLELQHVFAFVTGYYKCMRTHSLNAKNENLFFFLQKVDRTWDFLIVMYVRHKNTKTFFFTNSFFSTKHENKCLFCYKSYIWLLEQRHSSNFLDS